MSDIPENTYVSGPLGATYLKTALPIIFVMGMNGVLAVADALFLGHFVGPQALAAVTLMFPLYMLIVALTTLVAGGMSSVLARHLGAGRMAAAQAVFAGAHGLALALSAGLMVLFFLFGPQVARLAAGGSEALAQMGLVYLRITVVFSPLMFVLSLNSDALRNEGRVGLMAAMSLLVSVLNIGFNYVLIAVFELGVAGSAYGTVLAQAVSFALILMFRLRGRTGLRPRALIEHHLHRGWREILALGAPQSLNFVGLAIGSGAVVVALQMVELADYGATVSAYGVITRVMTFCYLPMLGLSFAMQSITGNNFGAQLWARSNASLRMAVAAGFVYCVCVQLGLSLFAGAIGRAFVDDPVVVAEVARILPVIVAVFFLAGPQMMIAAYFQAIGYAGRAAVLSLTRPYLFAIPLTFGLAAWFGEPGIWMAGPAAELALACLTVAVLARRGPLRFGLFHPVAEGVA